MGDIGGASQAAASVTDTAMNIANQQSMLAEENRFNREQAGAQRDWSAQQADLNRRFQAQSQLQAENYDTRMSDTAMQRRVADLKLSGLNPLLAAGNLGGATAPIVGGLGGSMASGAAASSTNMTPGKISPFSDSVQMKLSNAQAANLTADTANKKVTKGVLEDQRDMWDADTTPELMIKRVQTTAATYDLDYGKAMEVNSVVNTIRQTSRQADLDTAWDQIRNGIDRMKEDQVRATLNQAIEMQNAVAAQQTQEARNVTAAQSGLLGKTIAYAQAILTPVSTAAGAAQSGARAASTIKDMIP